MSAESSPTANDRECSPEHDREQPHSSNTTNPVHYLGLGVPGSTEIQSCFILDQGENWLRWKKHVDTVGTSERSHNQNPYHVHLVPRRTTLSKPPTQQHAGVNAHAETTMAMSGTHNHTSSEDMYCSYICFDVDGDIATVKDMRDWENNGNTSQDGGDDNGDATSSEWAIDMILMSTGRPIKSPLHRRQMRVLRHLDRLDFYSRMDSNADASSSSSSTVIFSMPYICHYDATTTPPQFTGLSPPTTQEYYDASENIILETQQQTPKLCKLPRAREPNDLVPANIAKLCVNDEDDERDQDTLENSALHPEDGNGMQKDCESTTPKLDLGQQEVTEEKQDAGRPPPFYDGRRSFESHLAERNDDATLDDDDELGSVRGRMIPTVAVATTETMSQLSCSLDVPESNDTTLSGHDQCNDQKSGSGADSDTASESEFDNRPAAPTELSTCLLTQPVPVGKQQTDVMQVNNDGDDDSTVEPLEDAMDVYEEPPIATSDVVATLSTHTDNDAKSHSSGAQINGPVETDQTSGIGKQDENDDTTTKSNGIVSTLGPSTPAVSSSRPLSQASQPCSPDLLSPLQQDGTTNDRVANCSTTMTSSVDGDLPTLLNGAEQMNQFSPQRQDSASNTREDDNAPNECDTITLHAATKPDADDENLTMSQRLSLAASGAVPSTSDADARQIDPTEEEILAEESVIVGRADDGAGAQSSSDPLPPAPATERPIDGAETILSEDAVSTNEAPVAMNSSIACDTQGDVFFSCRQEVGMAGNATVEATMVESGLLSTTSRFGVGTAVAADANDVEAAGPEGMAVTGPTNETTTDTVELEPLESTDTVIESPKVATTESVSHETDTSKNNVTLPQKATRTASKRKKKTVDDTETMMEEAADVPHETTPQIVKKTRPTRSSTKRSAVVDDSAAVDDTLTDSRVAKRTRRQPTIPPTPPASAARSTTRRRQNSAHKNDTGNHHPTIRILTTGLDLDNKQKKLVQSLGGILIDSHADAHTATHVIASDGKTPVRRTVKLMIALCCTTNIVQLDWLLQSAEQGMPLPCKPPYLLSDAITTTTGKESSSSYKFEISRTLRNLQRHIERGTRLLSGWSVYICDGVAGGKQAPPIHDFQLIIEAAGAQWLSTLLSPATTKRDNNSDNNNTEWAQNILIITSDPERKTQLSSGASRQALQHGASKRTKTWLFDAVMAQEIDL